MSAAVIWQSVWWFTRYNSIDLVGAWGEVQRMGRMLSVMAFVAALIGAVLLGVGIDIIMDPGFFHIAKGLGIALSAVYRWRSNYLRYGMRTLLRPRRLK